MSDKQKDEILREYENNVNKLVMRQEEDLLRRQYRPERQPPYSSDHASCLESPRRRPPYSANRRC